MKIALLTIHWANNYGASLQTFASVKALGKYGEVTVLDYRSDYAAKGMQLIRWGSKPRDLLRMGKDLIRLKPRARAIGKFREFTFRHLPLSDRLISDRDFLAVSDCFDLFVCGSDQIWNPAIVSDNDTIDDRYFLKFADKSSKKISYASSMGTFRYDDAQSRQVKGLLESFSAVSVRESDSAEYLKSLLGREVKTVVDPTLLLSRGEWLDSFDIQLSHSPSEPFILIYALKKDKGLKALIDFYRREFGLKVIAIDQDPILNYKPDQHVKDASPEEFLKLFNEAEFIITNSFHGTCFSVLFNKNFVVSEPPTGVNRIMSLLAMLGLSDRFVTKPDRDSASQIDWERVNPMLESIRLQSYAYLDSSVGLSPSRVNGS